jgi:hypothetical protein
MSYHDRLKAEINATLDALQAADRAMSPRRAWLQRQRQLDCVRAPPRQQQQPQSDRSADHTAQSQHSADSHHPAGVSGAGAHQSRPGPSSLSELKDLVADGDANSPGREP